MTSNGNDDNVIYTEEQYGKPAIQFTNVNDNETVAFPLLLVKGFVVRINGEQNEIKDLIVRRLKRNELAEEFNYRLKHDKFSVLLPLEAGENKFSFCISRYIVDRTYYYESSTSSLMVTPVLVVCGDENERIDDVVRQDLCAKIVVGCQLIQTLIAESLFQSGYERKTFSLENIDPNGNNGCIVFKSNMRVNTMSQMSAEDLWEYFGRELMTSKYRSAERKFVAFVSHKKGSKCTKQLAIGGGGLALCDLQFLKTWPINLDGLGACFGYSHIETNSNHWRKHVASFSASLGAVCHELCHTFDLGHTLGGIMGRDFDRVSSIFLAVNQPAAASTIFANASRETGRNDRLVVSKGTTRRTLNISYSVKRYPTDELTEKAFDQQEVPVEQNFWSNGCAVLLAHHRWIRGGKESSSNTLKNINGAKSTLHYDHIRGVVTSTFGIVVVQLRRQCGYVLKSWQFGAKRNKTLFLVPLYEARRASAIVIEDVEGNLLKNDLQNSF